MRKHVSFAAAIVVPLALSLFPAVVHADTAATPPSSAAPDCDSNGNLAPVVDNDANVRLAAGMSPPPEVRAAGYVVADADSGRILLEKNLHTPLKPASTLKVLTLLTALSTFSDMDADYVATVEDDNVEGSSTELVPGGTYTIQDLAYGLVLVSGNDAAHALAQAGGGDTVFAGKMNTVARNVNARDTFVVNSSGLDDIGQCVSVHDMAQFWRAGLRNEMFRKIFGAKTYMFPTAGRGATGNTENFSEMISQNKLFTHDYPGVIGGKTGFTDLAGRTYVVAAKRDGRTLVVVIYGFASDTEETATGLLDWGFANANSGYSTGVLPPPYASPFFRFFR